MDLEKIEKLNELKEKGLITEEEFAIAKARLLGGNDSTEEKAAESSVPPASAPVTTVLRANNYDYAMIMHLMQFCGWAVPFLGMIVPLVLWQMKKDDPYVDQQGRVIANWIISSFIYAIISVVLCLVLVGFALLGVLFICSIVFTIIGAVDANRGVVKSYPLSIRFFAVTESKPANLP